MGHSYPLILISLNQITGALGFNLYALLKIFNVSQNIRYKHKIIMKLMQVFIRLPLLTFAFNQILSFIIMSKLENKKLFCVEIVGGILQYINELDWLMN